MPSTPAIEDKVAGLYRAPYVVTERNIFASTGTDNTFYQVPYGKQFVITSVTFSADGNFALSEGAQGDFYLKDVNGVNIGKVMSVQWGAGSITINYNPPVIVYAGEQMNITSSTASYGVYITVSGFLTPIVQ